MPARALPGKARKQPAWITPTLATLTKSYFSDPAWIFEPKLDGIRCIAYKRGRSVKLLSRNKLDLTGGYPSVVAALARQRHDFILDGELAAVRDGVTSFSLLQQARRQEVDLAYFVFDIPFLQDRDLRATPLIERKEILKERVSWQSPLTFVEHIQEDGLEFYEEACRKRLEGVIAKLASSPYSAGRSRDWLKFKCSNEQEFVIGGYTDPQGERVAFGALVVGYYEGKRLHYAGKVGTGYTAQTLRDLLARMRPLEQSESPFEGPPPLRKNVHWLRPELVAQVGFAEWTGDGRLRHPRFLGLREDKKAKQVVREG